MTKAAPKTKTRKPAPAAAAARWDVAVPSRAELQQRKRDAVIRAAGHAFKAKGFHRTSLDEVAEALNVTKPALYHYVQGKRELLYETQSLALDLGDEALVHGQQGTTGRDRLERTISRYIELAAHDFLFGVGVEDMLPGHQEVIRKRLRAFDQRVRTMIQEGARDGSLRPCDPKLAISWLMGSVNWIPHWLKDRSQYQAGEIARTFVDFMMNGLATTPGPEPTTGDI